MAYRWRGPLAPYGIMTGDDRMFKMGGLQARSTPMPLRYQPVTGAGHEGAVDVGSIDTIDLASNPIMGSGRFLSAAIEPLVTPAIEKARMGINGPSVDLDRSSFRAEIGKADDGRPYLHITRGMMTAATLVSIPAFADQRLTISDDFQGLTAAAWTFEEIDDSEALTAAVNASGWEGLPIAHRYAAFKADDAIKRIAAWAGLGSDSFDPAKMKRAFLYMDASKPANDYTAYRLPVGDILGGKLTIIYHAVYAGAALINGAHGGLPAVPAEEKARLVPIINNIYKAMGEAFGEELNPPWNQGAKNRALDMDTEAFSIKTSWGLPMADASRTWDKSAALAALDSWAGDDMTKYGSAFLYKNPEGPVQKGSFKFPIAMPISGQLTIVPAAVRNAAARASSADIPAADKAKLVSTVQTLMKRIHGGDSMAMDGLVAGGGPLSPPSEWFDDPKLPGPTRLKITDEGRVYGHLGQLGVCHTGYSNVCITLPDSKTEYARFHQGDVICANGERIAVGKITLGTGHAGTSLAMRAAVEHYDHTGTVVAIVRAGRDGYGDWVAGSLVAGLDESRVAELRRSPLSGDWRYCQEVGGLELIAALAVNSPGFPVTEVVNGVQFAMTSAGMIEGEGWCAPTWEEATANLTASYPEEPQELTPEMIVALAADELERREERTARMAIILERQQMGRVERLARLTGE
jgi:hypothetical protein